MKCYIFLSVLYLLHTSIFACTIFVLTDGDKTLFFNNEDASFPTTHIWFLPKDKDLYGCAYLGFDDGWAQGGMNTEGLAFDWVAGMPKNYNQYKELTQVIGNPTERMLESCRTVDEAIAFYQKYREPSFSYARILIADKSGASVIIGAQDGKLNFEKSNVSRGFGYGYEVLKNKFDPSLKPTLANGIPALKACQQHGENATKYSNVFDLKSGDIHLVKLSDNSVEATLNMKSELRKGAHYYDINGITKQSKADGVMPLQVSMKRFILDGYTIIPDVNLHITNLIQKIFKEAAGGTLSTENYSPPFWKTIEAEQSTMKRDIAQLGALQSIALVEQEVKATDQMFLYFIEFENAIVLQRYHLNEHGKITDFKTEGADPKF